jgi:hypothetical protein
VKVFAALAQGEPSRAECTDTEPAAAVSSAEATSRAALALAAIRQRLSAALQLRDGEGSTACAVAERFGRARTAAFLRDAARALQLQL